MAIVYPNNTISEVGSGYISYPGNLIQVVEGRITATLAITTRDTEFELGTASITPTSASSVILIYIHTSFRTDMTQGTWSLGILRLRHTNTNSLLINSGWNGTWRHVIGHYSKSYLHSPASTSTQTYSLRHLSHPGNGSATYYANTGVAHDGYSYIRLMEFAP